MPMLVQWKWVDRTKSFLVIFHFWDNGRKTNLRMKMHGLTRMGLEPSDTHARFTSLEVKPYMTWAPSHVELGLLGEILRYANIIDGLSETEKRELIPKLEGDAKRDKEGIHFKVTREIANSMHDRMMMIDFANTRDIYDFKRNPSCCFEICIEYIDYLKKMLKSYLK